MLVATAQIVWPLAIPSAVSTPPERPPMSVLRIVTAVSDPGVTITMSETLRNARKLSMRAVHESAEGTATSRGADRPPGAGCFEVDSRPHPEAAPRQRSPRRMLQLAQPFERTHAMASLQDLANANRQSPPQGWSERPTPYCALAPCSHRTRRNRLHRCQPE